MRSSRRYRWAAIPVALATMVVLAGCSPEQMRGYLGGADTAVTNHTDRILGLWTTSWLVLLAVGAVTWGLILWSVIVYRRRRGQTGLPSQLRYNMPLEVLYTGIPLILVLGLFAFTARDQAAIEEPIADPDVTIDVVGQRWSWTFNYLNEDVYEVGEQAREDENGQIDNDSVPTLYLPVDAKVEIQIESRDVAHSFWIVDFLYKKDMIPGKSNYMYFVPLEEGTYAGKCAELCGEYHSLMLFNVEVVSQEEYDAQMAALRDAGQTGQLGVDYNVNQNLPGVGVTRELETEEE